LSSSAFFSSSIAFSWFSILSAAIIARAYFLINYSGPYGSLKGTSMLLIVFKGETDLVPS